MPRWTVGRVCWPRTGPGSFYAYTGVVVPTGQVVHFDDGRTDLVFGEEPDMDYGYVDAVKPGFGLEIVGGVVVAMQVPPGVYTQQDVSWIFVPGSLPTPLDIRYGFTIVDDGGSTDLYAATAEFSSSVFNAGAVLTDDVTVVGDGLAYLWIEVLEAGRSVTVDGVYLGLYYDDAARPWH